MLRKLLPVFGRHPSAPAARRPRLSLPIGGLVVYAVGDVHGCLDQLLELEAGIVKDGARYESPKLVIMLGDYVDRGPRSAQVIAHLLGPLPEGFTRICLCGNHEESMLRFVENPDENRDWLALGADRTLMSYNLNPHDVLQAAMQRKGRTADMIGNAVPDEHVAFLRALPAAVFAGRHVFAHAGIRPGVPLEAQTDRDLFWIRQPFLRQGPRLPLTVVHGHTPGGEPVVGTGRIGIDTGCYVTGRLTALRLLAGTVSFLSTR